MHHNYVSGRVHSSCGACLYHDDGSAFITSTENVCDMPKDIRSCCKWFISGGSPPASSPFCSTHDLLINGTFTNAIKQGVINHTYNTVIENTVDCSITWPTEAVAVMQASGFSEEQRVRRGWPHFAVPWQ